MGGERKSPEQIGEGSITHIKPAGERTEGRHHHPHLVRSKASSADCAATMRNSCNRMKMTTDFTGFAARQVTERQRSDSQRISKAAPDTVCRLRIMIAGNPDPFTAALHDAQAFAIACTEPGWTATVVEAIAECHDAARRIVSNQMRQVSQSRRCV